MGNPQKESFSHVDELLYSLPTQERRIVDILRILIHTTLPACREKLSYSVPFYYRHKAICFIWPASVPWGNLKEGVALGFSQGHLLDPDGEHLERQGRKVLGRMLFTHPGMIDASLIRTYLFEAEALDAELHRTRGKKR
ncbi:DUF1801 domain-containing protein [Roseivirga sp. BDSF3-8]|uniref:DUF1801 domain-containing protein n=1 Tax=Roseivirga sp. BDSF3-8 TaxID=3241598 RepID=UPI003531E746